MKILIIGFGRMGSWFAKELSKEHDVAVYTRSVGKLEGTPYYKINKPEDVKAFKPELVINAASLENTVKAFQAVLPYLEKNTILSDIASVKTGLKEFYAAAGFPFVSTHPMFGPTFANMERLKEENAVIIKESCEKGKAFFKRFYSTFGLHIYEYSFEEHDRMMAYSLSLPFALTLSFAAAVDREVVPGTTFKKHLAIAKGLLSEDTSLLTEILLNPYSLGEIDKVVVNLKKLRQLILEKDKARLSEYIEKLKEQKSR